jgi:hypothetical protein
VRLRDRDVTAGVERGAAPGQAGREILPSCPTEPLFPLRHVVPSIREVDQDQDVGDELLRA